MAERPRIPSKNWLLAAGRDLMHYWDNQGVNPPPEGERYRIWWHGTFQDVDTSWTPIVRGDIAETLDRYLEIAQRWHEKNKGSGTPPSWNTPGDLLPSVGFGVGAAGVVVAVLVVGVLLFRR